MGTKNLGLTQYPNATGNTILANWNSDAEKIDKLAISSSSQMKTVFVYGDDMTNYFTGIKNEKDGCAIITEYDTFTVVELNINDMGDGSLNKFKINESLLKPVVVSHNVAGNMLCCGVNVQFDNANKQFILHNRGVVRYEFCYPTA